jgi:hypothetical protein
MLCLDTNHHDDASGSMRLIYAGAFLGLPLATLAAQAKGQAKARPDTSYAAMQKRGKTAMGVDQYTSTHKFDALPTGGRIELQRDVADSAGVAQIRTHIRDIAKAFAAGDFSTPEFVHMQNVPGTKVMREKSAVISYEPRDLPRGAELLIRTKDSVALAAIHEFMAFQRGEHHAGGMDGMKHKP